MTRAIAIPQTEATAKVRATWLVAVLNLVTLGIYQIYWWFAINRELRDLGRSRGVDLGRRPVLSALAISVGSWVVVPYVWTVIATSGRIAEAERMAGLATTHKVWLASSLLIVSMALSMVACLLASSGVGVGRGDGQPRGPRLPAGRAQPRLDAGGQPALRTARVGGGHPARLADTAAPRIRAGPTGAGPGASRVKPLQRTAGLVRPATIG